MTDEKTIGQLWTDAVAYVALAVGAGLSITFNVVDVMDVRGAAVDRWDIISAVAYPSIVVLMVEMFVSTRWRGQGMAMQVIRWLGTLAIGGSAMLASWTHGHDFMLARGQDEIVATTGPLAIDLLAIMATALILSGRNANPPVANPPVANPEMASEHPRMLFSDPVATPEMASDPCPVPTERRWPALSSDELDKIEALAKYEWPTPRRVEVASDTLPDDLASGIGDEAEAWLSRHAGQTTKAPARRNKIDLAVAIPMMQAGLANGLSKGAVDDTIVAWFGCSLRTARRAREQAGLS